mgnify:CR=1 FL=1
MKKLKKRILISQQCRPELINETISKYKNIGVSANVSSFFDDVPKLLSESHLILKKCQDRYAILSKGDFYLSSKHNAIIFTHNDNGICSRK